MEVSKINDNLAALAVAEKTKGNPFKSRAYYNAIRSIKQKFGADGTVNHISELDNMAGVGTKITLKIKEMLETGELRQRKELANDDKLQAMMIVEKCHGLGPVLASRLVHEHAVRTLEDLRKLEHILPANAKVGLKYYEDSQHRIPFDECEVIARRVSEVVATVDRRLVAVCAGSHRRLAADSGDVDILISHPETHTSQEYSYLPLIVKQLQKSGLVLGAPDVLAEGDTKFMGYCRLPQNYQQETAAGRFSSTSSVTSAASSFSSFSTQHSQQQQSQQQGREGENRTRVRRIDIRFFPSDVFFTALLYFTGSARLNVKMRGVAHKYSYNLSEFGLFRVKRRYREEEEEDGNNKAAGAGGKQNHNQNQQKQRNQGATRPSFSPYYNNLDYKKKKIASTFGTKAFNHEDQLKELVIVPTSEKNVFDALHMNYLRPEQRNL